VFLAIYLNEIFRKVFEENPLEMTLFILNDLILAFENYSFIERYI
jgi:hypothetical protein